MCVSLFWAGSELWMFPTHFRSFKAFSEAPIDAVLGEWKVLVRPRTVRTLASSVFLNRGGRFVASTLPAEAMLFELARAYRLAGKTAEARATLQQIIDKHGTTPFGAEAKTELARLAS